MAFSGDAENAVFTRRFVKEEIMPLCGGGYFKIRSEEERNMWFVFALGAAVFAALTSVLAKIGIEGVGSNLATAVRTAVVLVMAWGMVFLTKGAGGISQISRRSWLFLILSGLATGASWLCYYRALQMGEASKVAAVDKWSAALVVVLAAVFLGERLTVKTAAGALFITFGAILMVL